MVYMPKDGKLGRAGAEILGGDPAAFRKGRKISGARIRALLYSRGPFPLLPNDIEQWDVERHSVSLSGKCGNHMREVQTSGMQAGWYPGAA
jgi:hypothetical protein